MGYLPLLEMENILSFALEYRPIGGFFIVIPRFVTNISHFIGNISM